MKIKSIFFENEELHLISAALWTYVADLQDDLNNTSLETLSEQTRSDLEKVKNLADEIDSLLISDNKPETYIL